MELFFVDEALQGDAVFAETSKPLLGAVALAFAAASLSGCELAYFPECYYDCGFTGGTRSIENGGS